MSWRLMYARAVVSYLVALRVAGHELREEIRAISKELEPWADDRPIPGRTNRYERLCRGHWVGYEVEQDDRTIRVVYVQSV
jgi:hypothetical protein